MSEQLSLRPCGTCGSRPARSKGECVNCYSRSYYAANKEKVKSRRSRYKQNLMYQAGDRTAEMPEFDLRKPIAYSTAHNRLWFWRGRAAQYACLECSQPATNWSYRGGSEHEQQGMVDKFGGKGKKLMAWSPDPLDYDPLCRSCHVTRDRAAAKATA